MPLSEDEQRILRQIEQELRADPSFDTRESSASPIRLAWLGLGIIAGIVIIVAAITVHPVVAFGVFVAVLWIGLRLESEARSLVRDRLSDIEVQSWVSGMQGRRSSSDNSET